MSGDEIRLLPAGPELDELVGRAVGHEPVVRWGVQRKGADGWAYFATGRADAERFLEGMSRSQPEYWSAYEVASFNFWPQYSRDMGAAWRLVEEMHRRGELLSLAWTSGYDDMDLNRSLWVATFRRSRAFATDWQAPAAICRAALLAQAAAIVELEARR